MTAQPLSAVSIRHSTIADIASFRELRLEALENNPTAFSSDYSENKLKNQEYWEERLNINNKEQALYFAEANGQLIGMAGIYRSLSSKGSHSAGIWGVFVKPSWRGRHIAGVLIDSCLEWAGRQKIAIVKLAVVTDKISAIHCYERCGFKIHGTEPKAIYYEGRYYDEHLMSIELEN